jgi:hypothetical protein
VKHTTISDRQEFWRLHAQDEMTYAEIANQYQVSKECVRYWCRRQRDGQGCQSQYRREKVGLLGRFDPLVRFLILRLKLKHPHWGPNRILYHLQKRPSLSGLSLPSEASLGRYVHQWDRFHRPPSSRKPTQRPCQPTRVHEIWQIDFKVGICLPDGKVNLHTIRDPFGKAYIGGYLYPATPGLIPSRVPMEDVRTSLRLCFKQWSTLPEMVQTDGEPSLIGKPNDTFPSRFTLWLTGMGIEHRIIRCGKPTDNAEVERAHRTLYDYAILGNEGCCLQQLQTIMAGAVQELNQDLPSNAEGCAGQAPLVAHPSLRQPRLPYQPEHELAWFDLKRVDAYLATYIWERKVDVNGIVYMGDRYALGRAYARQVVKVRFDPQDRTFVCFRNSVDDQEEELRRWPARHMDVEGLTGLIPQPLPVGIGPLQLALPLFWQRGQLVMSKNR